MYRTILLTTCFFLLVFSSVAQQSQDEQYAQDVERIREATDLYHNIEVAEAAGYPSTDYCKESEAGGMGHHFMNENFLDDDLDVEQPEILIYAPAWEEDGVLKLAAVQYVVPYSVWGPDETPPRILDQDLKPADEFQFWQLHVWAWKENSNGLFADWNPAIRCSR